MKKFLAITTYPAAILGCLLLLHIWKVLELPMEIAQLIVFAAAIAVVAACETIIPQTSVWRKSVGRDRTIDLLTFFSTLFLVFPLLNGLGAILAVALLVNLMASDSATIFPQSLPFIVQIFLAAVIAEFGSYWLHRLSHHASSWWKFHLIHHSASRIYWMNAYRSHPINITWHYFASIFVLLLIGTPADTVLAYSAFAAVVSVFQHANLSLRLGPLNYIFSTNEVHRWHHSTNLREANNNYGNVLMLWDHIFGTFFHQPGRSPGAVGLSAPIGVPVNSFRQLMVFPFKRTK